mmetsp:Transcript_12403/g.15054  ORF Transcript_12403/g.15054 Transcript_12403/m.15054 type:complete len:113 (-) Transcript_12403:177-515(-)
MKKRATATGTLDAIKAADALALDQFMIETDSPFMKPDKEWFTKETGMKKGNNEPAAMPAVCRAVSDTYDLGKYSPEDIADMTTKTAIKFFEFQKVDKIIHGSPSPLTKSDEN